MSPKGQLISKRFLGSSISSKKRTNQFVFISMRRVFVHFLEEIDDLKKPFRNSVTFKLMDGPLAKCNELNSKTLDGAFHGKALRCTVFGCRKN